MIPLANEENRSYFKQTFCYICKKEFSIDDDNEKYHKGRDHCHYTSQYGGAAHNVSNQRYNTPKKKKKKSCNIS